MRTWIRPIVSLVGFAVLSVGGCAGPGGATTLSSDHPAHPGAAESPEPPASNVLAMQRPPAATLPAAAMYVCPMHPDVRSPDPKSNCPKCGMKVNKPLVAATGPTAPAAGHDHGGH